MERLCQRFDARREAVGAALETVVCHDNAASWSCRTFLPCVPWGPMRRFLLICAVLVVLAVPAAAARASGHGKAGYLVVQRAVSDGGVRGRPVVTLVMKGGFVLGRASQEAKVEVYHVSASQFAVQVKGDVSSAPALWKTPHGATLHGKKYIGSNFRFRITGGLYRVVVRGAGLYVFAGGRGTANLEGSLANPRNDGRFSVDARPWRSMPTRPLKREIGRG